MRRTSLPERRARRGYEATEAPVKDLVTVKFYLTSLTKPLQFFGLIGMLISGVGLAMCLYLASLRVVWGQPLADRPFLLLGILLLVIGVQFLCVGILAEIQIRTYHESAGKATYAVQETLDRSEGNLASDRLYRTREKTA